MQRVQQMLLAEIGSEGLEAARLKLKKTAVTTVTYGDGKRLAVSRDEHGVERSTMVAQREVDKMYLRGDAPALAPTVGAEAGTDAPAKPRQQRCDEDILDASESPHFDVEDPALLKHLEEHGYAVVREVMPPEDREAAKALLWQFLAEHAGFDQADPSTWSDENFERVGCVGTGIIDGAGIGQSDFLWHLRLLPKVRQTFARVWGTQDLLASFDATNIFRPWHRQGLGLSRTSGGWFHLDQGRGMPGLQCVQGLISLLDADASTGGLVVVPGSHKMHEEIVRFQHSEGNYMSISPSDPVLELTKKLAVCRAGDLVLWDSRCVHCNAPARRDLRPELGPLVAEPAELLRMVGYVCMTPKANATEEVLQQRREAYRKRLTTSHWPHLFSAVRAGKQAKAGQGTELDLDTATAERRDLIG
mmetsp:Transcript_108411/g.337874  ORF Transcript_108411/g.337874 Transcript_108411/m.337874 type:complete len:417 (+) Transcript_108411:91-1341(+)